jgi:hypothetical protein
LRGVAIHYAGFNVGGDPAAIMRSIQRTHMEQRGWWDLAYSACVALDGTVLEGRGLLVRTGANGTNASNRDYLAICLLIGPDQTPTTAMVEAVRQRIGTLKASVSAWRLEDAPPTDGSVDFPLDVLLADLDSHTGCSVATE